MTGVYRHQPGQSGCKRGKTMRYPKPRRREVTRVTSQAEVLSAACLIGNRLGSGPRFDIAARLVPLPVYDEGRWRTPGLPEWVRRLGDDDLAALAGGRPMKSATG